MQIDMRTLLGLLPFAILLLGWFRFSDNLGGGESRRGILRVTSLWAAYSILSLELLSLVSQVNVVTLTVVWALPGALMVASMRQEQGDRRSGLRELLRPRSSGGVTPSLLIGIVLLLTFTVAVLAAPNTWDSLNYHMPRVAHWEQLNAVRHFPTGIEIQNSMSPAAEMLILHTYALAGGDRWANLVQWFSMLVSLVGVTLVAKQLGGSRLAQLLAAVFAASLPMAIVQASSTMTDFVVALFVLVVASETLELYRSQAPRFLNLLSLSLAASVAILTKPTAYAYLLPFALLVGVLLLRREGLLPTARWSLLALGLVLALNSGHYLRNYSTFGNPISQPSRIELFRSPWLGGRAFLSNTLRNIAMHAGTPSPHVNKGIALVVQESHRLLGLDVNDPRTTATGTFKVRWPPTDEDRVTNPVHAAFIAVSLGVLLLRNRQWAKSLFLYGGVVLGTFLAFSLLIKWQLYAGRYHLPFFVLMAPLVASIASQSLSQRTLNLLSVGLVLSSWPWLLGIKSRPLLPLDGSSPVGSVLTTPRTELYFANGPYLEKPYRTVTTEILDSGCDSVAVRLSGGAAEYHLWVLLGAPRSQVQIGWRVSGTGNVAQEGDLPAACAVVCEDCLGEGRSYGDLPQRLEIAKIQLFLQEP